MPIYHSSCKTTCSSRGFTLIELAIVLVILGLLAGSITVGKSLIKGAQLRSVITDVNNYEQAVLNFQKKYRYLPGDMPTAETYWGSDTGCPDTSYNTIPKVATCNGNGDGLVMNFTTMVRPSEVFRLWQHLSNAGMIDGKYTGARGPDNTYHVQIGVNVPQSRIESAGYTILHGGATYANVLSSNPTLFEGTYNHMLVVGANYASNVNLTPVLPPSDAWEIDAKIDDGKPGMGRVTPFKSSLNPGCTSSDTATSSTYVVTSYGNLCSLVFKDPF